MAWSETPVSTASQMISERGTMKKVLLVSVGGSPAPIIHSINVQKPDYLILYASAGSRITAVEQVLPALDIPIKDREFIMTPDEQDLEKSVAAILTRVPEILKVWGVTYDDLAADYTGGTKTMSASVVLALSRHIDTFTYIGGTERNKQGLGVVIDGREQMLYLKNPWNVLAVNSLNDIELLFNRCRYIPAADLAAEAIRKSPARKQLFEGVRAAALAFNLWDSFHYDRARSELKRCESLFRSLAAETAKESVRQFYSDIEASLPILESICIEQDAIIKSSPKSGNKPIVDGTAILRDLIANAIRRGEVEHKHDDAVARLYSAIEKMAKLKLKIAHGIDNSDVDVAMIPEPFRGEIVFACQNEREGGIVQLPLHKSYQLLEALGDSLGIAYKNSSDDLKKVLTIRNKSLLAHGYEPVKPETYEKMLAIAMSFLGVEKTTLPSFPRMAWGSGGL